MEPELPVTTVDVSQVDQRAVGTYGYRNITLILVTYFDMRLILRRPQRRKARSAMQ